MKLDEYQVLTFIVKGSSLQSLLQRYDEETKLNNPSLFVETWVRLFMNEKKSNCKRNLVKYLKKLCLLFPNDMVCGISCVVLDKYDGLNPKEKFVFYKILKDLMTTQSSEMLIFLNCCAKQMPPMILKIIQVTMDNFPLESRYRPTLSTLVLSDIFIYCMKLNSVNSIETLWKQKDAILTFLSIFIGWATVGKELPFQALYLWCLKDLEEKLKEVSASGYSGAPNAFAAHIISSADGLLSSIGDFDSLVREIDISCSELNVDVSESVDDEIERSCTAIANEMRVRRLVLVIGRLSPDIRDKLLEQKAEVLVKVLAWHIKNSDTTGKLASQLMAFCVDFLARNTTGQTVLGVYDSFIEMLWTDDEISSNISSFIASGLEKYETDLLPQLLGALGGLRTNTQHKHNILLTLYKYVSASKLQKKVYTADLIERLLEIVELEKSNNIRKLAGNVLACISPQLIVPLLARKVIEPNSSSIDKAYARASSVSALARFIETCTDPVQVVDEWLTVLNSNGNSEQLLDASKFWNIPQHAESRVLHFLVNAMLNDPSSPAPLGLLRRLINNKSLKNFQTVLEGTVLGVLTTGEPLDERILLGENPEVLKEILFRRLSPILFLRILPQETLEPSANVIGFQMFVHMASVYEFNDVRQQASEVFARLPLNTYVWPACEWVLRNLQYKCEPPSYLMTAEPIISPSSWSTVKGTIYIIYQVLTQNLSSGIPKDLALLIRQTLSLVAQQKQDESIVKLLQGFGHLFMVLIVGNVDVWKDSTVNKLIQPVEIDQQESLTVETGPVGLLFVCELLSSENESGMIIAANSLINSIRTIACNGGLISNVPSQKPTNIDENYVHILSAILTQPFIGLILEKLELKKLHPCLLQLLFTVTLLKIKVTPENSTIAPITAVNMQRLLSTAQSGLNSKPVDTRMWSLKLLGVVLTIPDEYKIMPAGATGQIVSSLRGLINMDENKEIRHLATDLLQSLLS